MPLFPDTFTFRSHNWGVRITTHLWGPGDDYPTAENSASAPLPLLTGVQPPNPSGYFWAPPRMPATAPKERPRGPTRNAARGGSGREPWGGGTRWGTWKMSLPQVVLGGAPSSLHVKLIPAHTRPAAPGRKASAQLPPALRPSHRPASGSPSSATWWPFREPHLVIYCRDEFAPLAPSLEEHAVTSATMGKPSPHARRPLHLAASRLPGTITQLQSPSPRLQNRPRPGCERAGRAVTGRAPISSRGPSRALEPPTAAAS